MLVKVSEEWCHILQNISGPSLSGALTEKHGVDSISRLGERFSGADGTPQL